jgi:hypothetical protein
MFRRKLWCDRTKSHIKLIDYPALAIPKLRDGKRKALAEKALKNEKFEDLQSVAVIRTTNHEARAKSAHAATIEKVIIGALVVLTFLGILAQALIFYVFVSLNASAALAVGAVTDLSLVCLLAASLYISLSHLYSWELGYSISLRIAGVIAVPVAFAMAILIFSRVANQVQAAALLASGILTYSLLVVGEFTPAMIASLASALRFSGDPERRARREEELKHEINTLNDFVCWCDLYTKELTDALAKRKTVEPPPPPSLTMDVEEHHAGDGHSQPPGKPPKPNGPATLAMMVLAALLLITPSQSGAAQNLSPATNALKCSIAIGGNNNTIDIFSRDEFVRQLIANSAVFSRCSQLRVTTFQDRGRFSPSFVYYPAPEIVPPDCSNPPPASENNRLGDVFGRIQSFRRNAEDQAAAACRAASDKVHQHNMLTDQELRSALQDGLRPTGDSTRSLCVDSVSALGFLVEEKPDILLVASSFAASCPRCSPSWQLIQWQLPPEARVVFVVLPSRGDVRVEGEAAYARANVLEEAQWQYHRQGSVTAYRHVFRRPVPPLAGKIAPGGTAWRILISEHLWGLAGPPPTCEPVHRLGSIPGRP